MCLRDEICTGRSTKPISALAQQINQAISMIEAIDDLTFLKHANGTGSVGEQFRHCLDFVNTFLKGIAIGQIDYSKRERDQRVEKDRSYAVSKFEASLFQLGTILDNRLNGAVSVRSEFGSAAWLISSVARELDFVFSHTVHHHALIAEKLVGFGISVDASFGVSPSTAEYRRSLAA